MRKLRKTKYFISALTFFIVGVCLIIFYRLSTNIDGFHSILEAVNNILWPFILGAGIAYLLAPIYNKVVRSVYKITQKKVSKSTAMTFARMIGSMIALLILVGIIAITAIFIMPQLIESIIGLIKHLPGYFDSLSHWIVDEVNNFGNESITKSVKTALENSGDKLIVWAKMKILPNISVYASSISDGAIITAGILMNIFISLLVALYILNEKEVFKAQSKKLIFAMMNEKKSEWVFDLIDYSNRVFSKYITGKILDSLIIGILCFIIMFFLDLPYVVLVSTIVGVTNVIPFFGPFIGAIPGILIIALVNPIEAVYFIIMIFLLQQLDSNIIQPLILSGATGISSFWVMFSIMVGGGLFGVVGMILGVPIFAIIYYLIGQIINKKLVEKELPFETTDYENFDNYNIDKVEHYLINKEYKEKKEKRIEKKIIRKSKKEQRKELKRKK